MMESDKSEVSHAVANPMCLNVANLRLLNVCILAYTLWVLQWSIILPIWQVHAQCTRDNMTAYELLQGAESKQV